MKTGTIIAIGGYTGKGNAGTKVRTIDKEIVRLSGKKHPCGIFLPTATQDSEKYVAWFEKVYGKKLKCKTDTLLLYKENLTHEQIKKKILSADIVFVGGGNTLKMMLRWKRFGVDKLLKQAYKKGAILAGVSAGAICWFEHGVSDSRHFRNPKSKKYIRVSGLGIVKGLVCPHFKSKTEDKGFRSKGLKNISRETGGVALAIGDGCAIEVTHNGYRVIQFSKGGKAYKVFWDQGRYVVEELKIHRIL